MVVAQQLSGNAQRAGLTKYLSGAGRESYRGALFPVAAG
jgi:hypothetical protein